MNRRSSWMGGSLLAALIFGLMAMPEADARAGTAGAAVAMGGGGHAAAYRGSRPRTGHSRCPASSRRRCPAQRHRARQCRARARTDQQRDTHTNNAQTQSQQRPDPGQQRQDPGQQYGRHGHGAGLHGYGHHDATDKPAQASHHANRVHQHFPVQLHLWHRRRTPAATGPTATARLPQPLLRNRYGYGRSQGNNRAIVSRLRSVHASLARLDARLPGPPRPGDAFDLDGHPSALAPVDGLRQHGLRGRHEQQLSSGHAGRSRPRDAAGAELNGGAGRRSQPHAPGAVRRPDEPGPADLAGDQHAAQQPGLDTTGHARARGHVQHAMRELNTALAIR